MDRKGRGFARGPARIGPLMKVVLLVLAAIGAIGCSESPGTVPTDAEAGSFIVASGELQSSELATVVVPSIFRVYNYKITSMAPEGTAIEAGQPLVSFDPSFLQQRLARAGNFLAQERQKIESMRLQSEAKLEQLRLTLAEKRAEVEKNEFLLKGAIASEGELVAKQRALELRIAQDEVQRLSRSIEMQLQTVDASVGTLSRRAQSWQYQVDQYQAGLPRLNVVAPKSGMVVYRVLNGRTKPTVGETVYVGQPLIDIPTLEKMIVVGQIPEADIRDVAVGSPVQVILDTLPDRVFSGEIMSLGTVLRPKSDNQPNVIMDSDISLLDPDVEIMRPGMTARLRISRSS